MPAVFVTGHSRSGTSMTAGLLASQGVWFGPCYLPSSINKKGFFESALVKSCIKNDRWGEFKTRWEAWMRDKGATQAWGVKTGPKYYQYFKPFSPIVVCTHRSEASIRESRERAGFINHASALRKVNELMTLLPEDRYIVYPDEFSRGEFRSIKPVLSKLGLGFNEQSAMDWIDPSLWHAG